jgi:hypothetical protein
VHPRTHAKLGSESSTPRKKLDFFFNALKNRAAATRDNILRAPPRYSADYRPNLKFIHVPPRRAFFLARRAPKTLAPRFAAPYDDGGKRGAAATVNESNEPPPVRRLMKTTIRKFRYSKQVPGICTFDSKLSNRYLPTTARRRYDPRRAVGDARRCTVQFRAQLAS